MPKDKFDTIIFPEFALPPIEILLAAKDYGKIYFAAPKSSLVEPFKTSAQTFDLEENFSVVELEISPRLKQELKRRTPQAQLDAKKFQVAQTALKLAEVAKKFNTLPPQEQNRCLDDYIAEVVRAEKILNEIFPALHSDTIKLNFNVFKEFLIDLRIYEKPALKQLAVADLNRQIGILMQDLNRL